MTSGGTPVPDSTFTDVPINVRDVFDPPNDSVTIIGPPATLFGDNNLATEVTLQRESSNGAADVLVADFHSYTAPLDAGDLLSITATAVLTRHWSTDVFGLLILNVGFGDDLDAIEIAEFQFRPGPFTVSGQTRTVVATATTADPVTADAFTFLFDDTIRTTVGMNVIFENSFAGGAPDFSYQWEVHELSFTFVWENGTPPPPTATPLRLKLSSGLTPFVTEEVNLGKLKIKGSDGAWYQTVPEGAGTVVKQKLEDGLWYDAFWLSPPPTLPADDTVPGDDLYPSGA